MVLKPLPKITLSGMNPSFEICNVLSLIVTFIFLAFPCLIALVEEDYINWNGKSGNVGISGRNYPDGYILEDIIHQYITQMLGYSIAE